MPGHADLPLDPLEFIPRFATAADRAGFRVETFGGIQGHPLIACTKPADGGRPRIYLSAGIHGDEPAPAWTLLRLVETGRLDDRASWFVCPLLNPTGFAGRTRENAGRVDLNRDYKTPQSPEIRAHTAWLKRQPVFDLVICIHEDWEAQGFYLYELNPENRPSLAHAMLEGARAHGPIDTGAVIDGREIAEPGIIRPVSDPLLRETWPEAIYLREHHGTLHYTIESASRFPLEQRTATLESAINAALAEFLRQSESSR